MNNCLYCKATVVLLMHWISVLMTNVFFLGRMMVGGNHFDIIFFANYWVVHAQYIAISIKVVPKKREKVEYERERLIGKD